MKTFRSTLLVAAVVTLAPLAHAQIETTDQQQEVAAEDGSITNSTVTTQVTVETQQPLQADPTFQIQDDQTFETLPNTGGAPLAMSLAGLLLAGAAYGVRRKVS